MGEAGNVEEGRRWWHISTAPAVAVPPENLFVTVCHSRALPHMYVVVTLCVGCKHKLHNYSDNTIHTASQPQQEPGLAPTDTTNPCTCSSFFVSQCSSFFVSQAGTQSAAQAAARKG